MAATVESSVQPAILQAESEAFAAPAAPPKTPQKYSDANRGSMALQIKEKLGLSFLQDLDWEFLTQLSLSWSPESSSAATRRAMSAESAFRCKTCGRSFATFQALGGHRTSHMRPKVQRQRFPSFRALGGHWASHTRQQVQRVESSFQALGGHHRTSRTRQQARMPRDSDDPAGIRARSFHESGNYTTNDGAGGGGGAGGAAQGSISGGGVVFATGGYARGATDQGGVPSSRDQVSISVPDLEALLAAARTAENNNGDDEGATVNAKQSIEQADPVDLPGEKEDPVDYTSPMVGVFTAAIALRASSITSYTVLLKALGDPRLARLAYEFPWVLIFILGVGLLVNVAFDRSARARVFGKYALLLAIAVILCLATWCWSSLQITAA